MRILPVMAQTQYGFYAILRTWHGKSNSQMSSRRGGTPCRNLNREKSMLALAC